MKKFLSFLLIMTMLFPCSVFALDSDSTTNSNLIENAVSGILIEASTGKILFEKERDKEVAIASMTKMVAQIIILENIEKGSIKWDDVVTVSKNAADMGGSQIYISQGEQITIRDLMKGISMASGNDVTVQMAEVIAGSEEKFVEMMNKKVKELGLKHTQFKNCTGLDEEGHYSSAYDMAMIAKELVMNHPTILEFSSVYEDYLREDTDNKFWLVNTNKLVRYYEGADGLKTGHTDNAKYCLAATAKKNDMRLIAIVLGEENSKTRNSEAMGLLDYGFNSIKMNVLKKAGSKVKSISFDKADKDNINVILKDDLGVIEDKTAGEHKYTYKVKMNSTDLPIKKGQVIGKIEVLENKKVVSTGELISNESVERIGYLKLILNGFKETISGIM